MWKYAVRRTLIAALVLFLISVLDFVFINLAPGDPLQAMLPPETATNGANIQALYQKAGLNDSIPVRYLRWVNEVLHGNFGTSFRTNQPATTMIGQVVPATLLLTVTAKLLALALGVPLGVLSGLRERSWLDQVGTVFSFVSTAIPGFFLAIVTVFVLAVHLRWFPATGIRSYGQESGPFDVLRHLILPACVLGVLAAPGYVRYTRTAVIDVLGDDYIRTARAKGLRERTIIWRHILPNALMPLITVIGLGIPALLGGSVLIEQVFAWPGMGQLSINSALYRDYPVFMGTALFYALVVLVSSIVTDLAYAVANPRIRYE